MEHGTFDRRSQLEIGSARGVDEAARRSVAGVVGSREAARRRRHGRSKGTSSPPNVHPRVGFQRKPPGKYVSRPLTIRPTRSIERSPRSARDGWRRRSHVGERRLGPLGLRRRVVGEQRRGRAHHDASAVRVRGTREARVRACEWEVEGATSDDSHASRVGLPLSAWARAEGRCLRSLARPQAAVAARSRRQPPHRAHRAWYGRGGQRRRSRGWVAAFFFAGAAGGESVCVRSQRAPQATVVT